MPRAPRDLGGSLYAETALRAPVLHSHVRAQLPKCCSAHPARTGDGHAARVALALADQVGAPGGPHGATAFTQVRQHLRRKSQDPMDFASLTQMAASYNAADNLDGPKRKAEALPASWDWRNGTGGHNWLEP